jgi:transcriptional regulator with GAF, ATPase, and Fis domain
VTDPNLSANRHRPSLDASELIEIPGRSPAIRRLRAAVSRVARFPTVVLLTGETGTGKGRVARALHAASSRRDAPFVHVDCAGLVDGLLESELYGAAKGAYTGAQQGRAGRFEAAGAGTLFLDEVGELSIAGQLKLLRVLEEGSFERIGETRTRLLRARVVAATHVDLEAAVARGSFRADLYFRLHVLRLEIPPLRDRVEDLPDWIDHAARRVSRRFGCAPPRFDLSAIERLQTHDWPGNLRELFHVVEAATVLADTNCIRGALVEELLVSRLHRTFPLTSPLTTPPASSRAAASREAIRDESALAVRMNAEVELDRAKGNVSLAARRLGIPRSTLRYRLGLDDAISRGRRLREARSIPDEPQRG